MKVHLLHLKSYSIFEQLQLEEALLRSDTNNWCIINEGSPPAIVMGISGKAEELIIPDPPIPIIKRFSGGGTVVVDENTLFITFIFQKTLHPFSFPEPIMRWSEELYQKVFPIEHFHLRENDFAIQEKKCGGNAQYIKKDRWLHHTSFLWDYHEERMEFLLHPKKTPKYRMGRKHTDFICRLKEKIPSRALLINNLKKELGDRYIVEEAEIPQIDSLSPHRQETCLMRSPKIRLPI